MQNLPTHLILSETTYRVHMENNLIDKRISLRRLTNEDLTYFYTWASDQDVVKSMIWQAYSSLAEAEKFLKSVVENHQWFKAICLDGIPVGSITLTQGSGNASCRADLGYVLAKAYWGKGIATAATKQAIQTGFSELAIQRIEAFVDPENIPSRRVLIKAGMDCEGLLKSYIIFKGVVKDRYIYSITKALE